MIIDFSVVESVPGCPVDVELELECKDYDDCSPLIGTYFSIEDTGVNQYRFEAPNVADVERGEIILGI